MILNLNTDIIPVSKAMLGMLQKHYLGLEYSQEGRIVVLDGNNIADEHKDMLQLDIYFYTKNPTIPLENLCSHLSLYKPQNESQEELLEYAKKLVTLKDDTIGAGLFMYGEAGIGKSHIAIGISKLFMQQGLSPNFQIAEHYGPGVQIHLAPGQVWVIDDMNSGYHFSSRLFKQVVLNAHDKGGRVFVTSNKEYSELMSEMFVGDSKANKMRYEDRTKGMFKILHVTGNSRRRAQAWYNL
jgi:DNA replication protein DnaC